MRRALIVCRRRRVLLLSCIVCGPIHIIINYYIQYVTLESDLRAHTRYIPILCEYIVYV